MPRWHPVSISGYHIREAGSTAAQELAFTLKDGFTYVEEQIERGVDVDDFAPRLSFFFNAHIDFFEEIAKYRAARRIWARELRETYGAKNPKSWLMRFHTQTAGVSLTAQQPLNNIARTAIEALAGVLGGTQSLHTNSYDEALALPTEDAVRIALRTQQVIAHETGVTNTIDPLGGSYFVESLTDELEAAAYAYFRRIDELGGMVEAVKQNFPQREIADASFDLQRRIDARRADRGRRQPLHRGRRRRAADPPHRPCDRAQADRPPERRARPPRRRGGRGRARRAAPRRRLRRQPDAAAARRRARCTPARARSSPRSRTSGAPTPRRPSSERSRAVAPAGRALASSTMAASPESVTGESARERILATAYELFSRYGTRAVGVDRIVAESGVAKMTLYRNFASKDELIVAFLAAPRGALDAAVAAGRGANAAATPPRSGCWRSSTSSTSGSRARTSRAARSST